MLYKRAVPLRRGAAPRNGRRRRGVAGERKSTMSPVSDRPVSERVIAATDSMAAVQDFYFNSRYDDRRGQTGVCDFTFGNTPEFPLPGRTEGGREGKEWGCTCESRGSTGNKKK